MTSSSSVRKQNIATGRLWAKYNWNCIIAVSPRAPGIHTPFQKVSSKWGMTRSLRRAIPGAKMVFYSPGVVLPVVF